MATILIVDDRAGNREYLTTLLGYGGHRLLEAADGASALALVRLERPHLVITDILMPTMDGYEFAQSVRGDPDPSIAQTPIIFYTATYSAREALALARAAGVSHVIAKPSRPHVILDTVNTALGLNPPVPPRNDSGPLVDPMRAIGSKLTEKMSELNSLERRLTALVELMLKVSSERDPERLLNIACDSARTIVGAQYAAIGMLGDDRHSLRHFVSSGLDPETIARIGPLPTGKGVLGKLLDEGLPLRLADLSADPSSVGFPPGHPPMRSFLGVPIASAGGAYGRLYLTEKIGALEFTGEDERVAVALAAQVAVAYENALRYDEIQTHAARLQLEITERKLAEAALRVKNQEIAQMTQQLWQAAKLATMGELAASIAHELNNPLATVSLRVETLLGQVAGDDAKRRGLLVIQDEVERMGRLVANLLQFGRRSATQVSTMDVHDELASTLELVLYHMRGRNVRIIRDLANEALLVRADRQQLRQVFLNLFTNAADAMPRGGTLTIRTWTAAAAAAADSSEAAGLQRGTTQSLGLPVSRGAPQAVVEISDSGQGIPPEAIDKVWEPFYTTKPEGKGTGLGLAICRRIVQEHGGTIEVSSDGVPGKGTLIRITLPAAQGAQLS